VLETATPRPPPRIHRDVELRRIESEADWAAVIELELAKSSRPRDVPAGERCHARRRRVRAELARDAPRPRAGAPRR
jgi:hypothetical protein